VSAGTVATHDVHRPELISTARATGLLYLGLAITGFLGFLLIRSQLFDPDNAATTLAQLVDNEQLARLGIAMELGIVLTQALAALWFYRLFRSADSFMAGAIGAFGLVNAIAILASAAFIATALQVALDPVGDPGNAQLMYIMSDNLWGVGGLFFGLWLIPMGICVLRSRWMPRPLGLILVAGGVGYILSAFVRYLVPDVGALADILAIPASVGEFWMIGYLLFRGVNRQVVAD